MSLEVAIQNLADAINNLAGKSSGGAVTEPTKDAVVTKPTISDPGETGAQAVKRLAAEKKVEAAKAAAAEASKTPEPEVIPAGEKTEAEEREAAFNIPDGYCTKPFLELGKGGQKAKQLAILEPFKVKRLSEVKTADIPKLKAAIEAALAEGK